MQLKELDRYARWIDKFKFDSVTMQWQITLVFGKTIIAPKIERAINMVQRSIAFDVACNVAEVLNVNAEVISSQRTQKRENSDARKVMVHILLNDFGFSYALIREITHYSNNGSLKYSIDQSVINRAVYLKLEKVYSRFPWIKNTRLPIR